MSGPVKVTDRQAGENLTSHATVRIREREVKLSKTELHLVLICSGIVLAIIVTFISGTMAHYAAALPVAPSAIQELLDRLFGF